MEWLINSSGEHGKKCMIWVAVKLVVKSNYQLIVSQVGHSDNSTEREKYITSKMELRLKFYNEPENKVYNLV